MTACGSRMSMSVRKSVLGGASYATMGPVDIAELQVQARKIRETYARETARRYGRSWTPEEYMLGLLTVSDRF